MKQNPHFDSTVQIVRNLKLNAILNRSTNTFKMLQSYKLQRMQIKLAPAKPNWNWEKERKK
jgi:hypothetical protein